jgi:hypothetical protein
MSVFEDLYARAVLSAGDIGCRTEDFVTGGIIRVFTVGVSDSLLQTVFTCVHSRKQAVGDTILKAVWTCPGDNLTVEFSALQFSDPSAWTVVDWEEFRQRVQGRCGWGGSLNRSTFPRSIWTTFVGLRSTSVTSDCPFRIYFGSGVKVADCERLRSFSSVPVVAFHDKRPFEDLVLVMANRAKHRHAQRLKEAAERRLQERYKATDSRVIQAIESKYEKHLDLLVTAKVERRLAAITNQLATLKSELKTDISNLRARHQLPHQQQPPPPPQQQQQPQQQPQQQVPASAPPAYDDMFA